MKMNNARRKKLAGIVSSLESAQELLEELRDEEQDYLDNMPESLQSSDKYSIGEEAIENMESAIDSINEVIDYVESAKS